MKRAITFQSDIPRFLQIALFVVYLLNVLRSAPTAYIAQELAMAKPSESTTVPHFKPLSSSILLHAPEKPATGQLIILATWMGGQPKHIAKYISLYKQLTPDAKILLIKCTLDSMLYPYPIQRRNIRPAIAPISEVLNECGYTSSNTNPDTPPRILLHVFSNGGANSISQLLRVWRQEMEAPLPLSGLIVDSALAVGGFHQNYYGFLRSMPSNFFFQKIIGPPALLFALFVLETSIALGRYPRPETLYRECLLDEDLVQVEARSEKDGVRGKRVCYFASTKDETTPWRDVISHSEEAKKRGWDVEMHMWDDTVHCNHLGKHETEYTTAVRGVWERAKL